MNAGFLKKVYCVNPMTRTENMSMSESANQQALVFLHYSGFQIPELIYNTNYRIRYTDDRKTILRKSLNFYTPALT